MTRQLKYVCFANHRTLLPMPNIDEWQSTIRCPVCEKLSFFMSVEPAPEPDVDETIINRRPGYIPYPAMPDLCAMCGGGLPGSIKPCVCRRQS